MQNLPALLLLCVAVCSAYPVDRAAEDKDSNMDLLQVIDGRISHRHWQGRVGTPPLLSIHKHTGCFGLTVEEKFRDRGLGSVGCGGVSPAYCVSFHAGANRGQKL